MSWQILFQIPVFALIYESVSHFYFNLNFKKVFKAKLFTLFMEYCFRNNWDYFINMHRSTGLEKNPIDIIRDFGILFRKPPFFYSNNRASVFRICTTNKYTNNSATKTGTVRSIEFNYELSCLHCIFYGIVQSNCWIASFIYFLYFIVIMMCMVLIFFLHKWTKTM